MLNRTITEALSPGEARQLKIQIGNYTNKIAEIEDWKSRLKQFSRAKHPAEMIDKLTAIQEKYQAAIDKMEQETSEEAKGLVKLAAGIKKNCGIAINLYKRSGKIWHWSSSHSADVLFAKSKAHPPTTETMRVVDNMLAKDFNAEALFSNSEYFPAFSSLTFNTTYIVFPIDGAKFTRISGDLHDAVVEDQIGALFDGEKLRQLHNKMYAEEGENNHKQWVEFCNRSRLYNASSWSVGEWDGFGGPNTWDRQWAVIEDMVQEGKLPTELLNDIRLENLISVNTLLYNFSVKAGPLQEIGHVLCSGQFYAIKVKHKDTLLKLLNIESNFF